MEYLEKSVQNSPVPIMYCILDQFFFYILGYKLENCTFYEIIAHSHTLVHVVTINLERYTIFQLPYTF